jgi:hypothetical protein
LGVDEIKKIKIKGRGATHFSSSSREEKLEYNR